MAQSPTVAAVINFNRLRRYRPPPPPAVKEPTAEDIEAALRIAILKEELRGLRLRNRIAADFLFRRCLRGLLFWGAVLFILVQCSRGAPAAAELDEALLGQWCHLRTFEEPTKVIEVYERRDTPCSSWRLIIEPPDRVRIVQKNFRKYEHCRMFGPALFACTDYRRRWFREMDLVVEADHRLTVTSRAAP
jgi:hypothetical protein